MNADDLKSERERRGDTQHAIAAWLGVPLSTYRKWEQGARKVPVWVSEKLVPQTVQIEKVTLAELAELDGLAREEGITLDTLLAGFIREGLARRKSAQTTASPTAPPAPTSAKRATKEA